MKPVRTYSVTTVHNTKIRLYDDVLPAIAAEIKARKPKVVLACLACCSPCTFTVRCKCCGDSPDPLNAHRAMMGAEEFLAFVSARVAA